MSADNKIVVYKKAGWWYAEEQSMEGNVMHKLGAFSSLENAVKESNDYMEENEVEYGLDIQI